MNDSTLDQQLLLAWQKNANAWHQLIKHQAITSRNSLTNPALINALSELNGHRILDLGCGEGWLTRRLNALGKLAVGIDGAADLIACAQQSGAGLYHVCTYQQFAQGQLQQAAFDIIVANFSLLGEQSTIDSFRGLAHYLVNDGYYVIQTLHPFNDAIDHYQAHWRCDGFQADSAIFHQFTGKGHWYYRTLSDWFTLFEQFNMSLVKIIEPKISTAKRPSSIIFILKKSRVSDKIND